jgi:hypothetical protein
VNLYGYDIDEHIETRWQEVSTRNVAKHLYLHDGLLDNREIGLVPNRFDIVVGNPPYGGTGLSELHHLLKPKAVQEPYDPYTPDLFADDSNEIAVATKPKKKQAEIPPLKPRERKELIALANFIGEYYETWKRDEEAEHKNDEATNSLFEEYLSTSNGQRKTDTLVEYLKRQGELHVSEKDLKKIIGCPIELLFTERFLQLAKPSGYIAIILPDGVFSNATLQYFRNWLLTQAQILAILSLPRSVFTYAGANAKTSILFMRKYDKSKNERFERFSKSKVLITHSNEDVTLQDYFTDIIKSIKKRG